MNGVELKEDGFSAKLEVAKKKDVVVVGAGPAGCLAALSARRNGADVLLIEKESYLGGMMTGGFINILNAYRSSTEGTPLVVRGISLEVFKRLLEAGGTHQGEGEGPIKQDHGQITDPAIMVHVLDEMMEESNVEVLFNTFVFDTIVENDVVKGVAIANKSGGQVVLADIVVDASADADIASAAGVPFVYGREKDGRFHGGSMWMEVGGIEVERFINYLKKQPVLAEEERERLEEEKSRLLGGGGPPNIALALDGKPISREPMQPRTWDQIEKDREEGRGLRFPVGRGGPTGLAAAYLKEGKYVPMPAGLDKEWIDYIKRGKVPPLLGLSELIYPPGPSLGHMGFGLIRNGKRRYDQMMSGVYEAWFDSTNQEEVSKALVYMRKLNKLYTDFLRECIPGFEEAYIIAESPTVGTRESRRIIGEHVLTEEEASEGIRFPDVIAKCGRAPNAHSVTAVWGTFVNGMCKKPYDIPYSCLVPKKINNLLVAGRCISTTHLASGGIRDQATCMSTGEAAGAAASLSAKLGVTPRNLDIKLLQKMLLGQGALLFLEDEKAREKEILGYNPSDKAD